MGFVLISLNHYLGVWGSYFYFGDIFSDIDPCLFFVRHG